MRFMRRVVVPSCYVYVSFFPFYWGRGERLIEEGWREGRNSAFSTVVANKRFAPLGVVLVGILASVHQFVGPEPGESSAAEKVKVKVKEVELVEEEEGEGVGNVWALDQYALDLEDLGESIGRGPGDGDGDGGGGGGGGRRCEDVEGLLATERMACGAGGNAAAAVVPEEAVVTAVADAEPSSKRRKKNKALGKVPPQDVPSQPPEPSLPVIPLPPPPPPPPHSQSLPPSRQKPKKRQKVDDALREPRKKQKKQKKRDEIDELFSGIL